MRRVNWHASPYTHILHSPSRLPFSPDLPMLPVEDTADPYHCLVLFEYNGIVAILPTACLVPYASFTDFQVQPF